VGPADGPAGYPPAPPVCAIRRDFSGTAGFRLVTTPVRGITPGRNRPDSRIPAPGARP